tara:strand:+ start:74 stop:532 length:459 start_codon:yes stop_codon:yes gene_type:complete
MNLRRILITAATGSILIIALVRTEAKDLIAEPTEDLQNDCRATLIGTFEYEFSNLGKSTIVYSKSKVYYFREFPTLFYAECIEWTAPCTYNLEVCQINDPIIPQSSVGNKAQGKITAIKGNKVYFERYEEGKKVNDGFLTKIDSTVPEEFKN